MTARPSLDVLVVGAGPTGLALATQLRAYGARLRIIDRHLDRARESRALAIQPRTLEALAPFGITDELVHLGNPAVQLRMHARDREVRLPLFDLGITDTPYPFLLFLSQAETERVLGDHLGHGGTNLERGTELLELTAEGDSVSCVLRHRDGTKEVVNARYVVGCDGARSTVRVGAGIRFEGHAYPQTFLLADLEVDGLAPSAAHAWMTDAGMVFFFPLGSPASWRMLAMKPPHALESEAAVSLSALQSLVDRYVSRRLRLRDPVWMTDFRIHNRGARSYRSGRIFLAGDAAHIHSPAGAQGMNTGIQDALNLGWKIGHVCRGAAPPELLDTYQAERAPIGGNVLRFTDRAFRIGTSRHPLIHMVRTHVAPRLAPLVLHPRPVRALAFRTLGQLALNYRHSPLSVGGPGRRRRGPNPGDRLPDTPGNLHAMTSGTGFDLFLTGPRGAWDIDRAAAVTHGRAPIHVHALDASGPWHDTTHVLVRPDGYIAYCAVGTDLSGLATYLDRWLPRAGDEAP